MFGVNTMSKFQKSPLFLDASKEQIMEQLRLWRNKELALTDWTMISDAPTDKEAWSAYRQALRDLPSQSDDAEQIELPVKPF